jgi:hypothetical protein
MGVAADSALWRDKYLSGGVLGGSTLVWFLLEKSGYTFMTLLCNILMFVVVILFVWSNVAALLHRFSLLTCMMICTQSAPLTPCLSIASFSAVTWLDVLIAIESEVRQIEAV